MRPNLLVGILVVFLGLVGGGAWLAVQDAPPPRQAPQAITPDHAARVALGQGLYQEHCAVCHGVSLAGEPGFDWRERKPSGALPAPPHDPSGHTWHHPDWQLFAMTKHGLAPFAPEGYVSDMPAFADLLEDEEIWAVLSYIKSTWPPETRATHDSINTRVVRPANAPR